MRKASNRNATYNLPRALCALDAAIARGEEYPDAEYRISEAYGVPYLMLREAYDAPYTDERRAYNETLREVRK